METAAGIVQENANPDANIIFGATICEDFQDEMRVTVIATGFDQANFGTTFKKPEAQKEVVEAEMKPVEAPADIGEIDEIFKIFSR